MEARGITPAAPADKRTLLRRATFDLIGLPPTPAEIDAFLADDSPQAFAKVVDRLLASPQYGERWGRHWLDVVRYADARDLIQLPRESDFREAWRYRDWVVESFNRDLPYTEFVRSQVAGDLLPSPRTGGFNKDGLVATGMLAIADFVPGDADKNQMIADYVNDQVDVVSRAFLGLSVACARCHDHKFDPISTEDYYALSGIFFSTRIIPGPVAGNTPLVRVPLLSPVEIAQLQAGPLPTRAGERNSNSSYPTRPTALSRLPREPVHRAVGRVTSSRPASAASRLMRVKSPPRPLWRSGLGLHAGVLTEWVAFLDQIEKHPREDYPLALREAAAGKLSSAELEKAAALAFQESLVAQVKRDAAEAARCAEKHALTRAALLHFRADDPRLATDADGRVTLWPNRAGFSADATPPFHERPIKTAAKIGDHTKPVIRFDGQSVLEAQRPVPPAGTLFIVYQTAVTAVGGERIVGWEDADVGRHGLGLMPDKAGPFTRSSATTVSPPTSWTEIASKGFESVCITWGPNGTTLRRNGVESTAPQKIDGLSSDPKITALKIGGPGSGGSSRFHGDIAELRVYGRPLNDAERMQVEAELRDAWFQARRPAAVAARTARRVVHRVALAPRSVLAAADRARQAASTGSSEAT